MAKEKMAEAVKQLLPLHDTSVDAILHLNGKEYPVDNFEILFQQSFDFKGEPQREVKGGLLSFTFNQISDAQINYWMFHNNAEYSGMVTFGSFSMIDNPPLRIEFIKGRCSRYTKSVINGNLTLNLIVTAKMIKMNGMEHKNDFKFNE